MAPPAATVELRFDPAADGERIASQVSAVVQVEDDLWVAADEGCTIERLSPDGAGYGHHASFRLRDHLDLPGADDEEVDLEGLEWCGGYLWLVGSHSARRRKLRDDGPARLAEVARDRGRYLLGRIPLVRGADGRLAPARRGPAPDDADRTLRAARLPGGRRNPLVRAMGKDRHLAPFLTLPGKDNGLDIEGFAMTRRRGFLGLRGPVLRGWATVLAIKPRRRRRDRLRLRRLGADRHRYEKHFLDLHGLGVRELCVDGDDLLILAGPTMALDGMCGVYRWRDALAARGDTVVPRDQLARILELPYGRGDDETQEHPEGLCVVERDGARHLMVTYDAPAPARRRGPGTVLADLYRL